MVAHTFNPRQADFHEFKVSLLYRAQEKPCWKKKKPKTKQNRRNKRRDIESTKENVQIDKFFPPYYQGVSGLPLPKTSQRKALGSISPQLIPFLLFEKFLKLKDSAREKKIKR